MSLEGLFDILESVKDGNITSEVLYTVLNNYEPNKVAYCLKKYYPELTLEYLPNSQNNKLYNVSQNESHNESQNESNNMANIKIRDDAEYRAAVKSRFQTCIICEPDMCVPECCQVAHIWDFAKCDNASKYNPDNGLLMCANWHLLFDANLMRLEPVQGALGMVKIILVSELKNSAMYKYHNKIITILPENIEFLEARYH
jgi:hypothetical protein